jgi:hypothetical protein
MTVDALPEVRIAYLLNTDLVRQLLSNTFGLIERRFKKHLWYLTAPLTLREQHRLEVFENRVPRRIFGPKRNELTAEWRKLHNEKLQNLYSSPDIIRQVKSRWMRWAGHVARDERKMFKVLVGKTEAKRPPGRLRCRWVNGIRIYHRETG